MVSRLRSSRRASKDRDEDAKEEDDEQGDGQGGRQEDAEQEGVPSRTRRLLRLGRRDPGRPRGRTGSAAQNGIAETLPQRPGYVRGQVGRTGQIRAVKIAPGAHDQAVLPGHVDQGLAEFGRIPGIEGLEAVQPPSFELFHQPLEGGEIRGPARDDRMGQDGQAPGLVQDPDGLGRRRGPRDPAAARRVVPVGPSPVPVEGRGQGLEIGRPFAGRVPSQELAQSLVLGVEPVSEEVLFPLFGIEDGELDAGDEADAPVGQGVPEGRQALDGVVVGQGGRPDPRLGQPLGQVGRRQGAIAQAGMGMEVEADGVWHVASQPGAGRTTIASHRILCQ